MVNGLTVASSPPSLAGLCPLRQAAPWSRPEVRPHRDIGAAEPAPAVLADAMRRRSRGRTCKPLSSKLPHEELVLKFILARIISGLFPLPFLSGSHAIIPHLSPPVSEQQAVRYGAMSASHVGYVQPHDESCFHRLDAVLRSLSIELSLCQGLSASPKSLVMPSNISS